ncbi:hypothetical protein N7499_011033 [Penicillium canescens]|nr:hypothetical protein N7499_011033 [Penicillium canescens]KAJ6182803.1 hypothetical protein N7485_001445 [Penicillium canescens]
MKHSLNPALKPGPTPRLAAKPALRAPQYTEEGSFWIFIVNELAGYNEESGVDDEEEEEQEETHNGYHGDENEYSDQEDEYDDDEEEGYDEYDDEENEYDQGEGDGYDEGEGEENDELDQEGPDHDSFDDGPELIYHAERELDCVDIALVRRRAQNHYGLLLTSGSILGWRKTKLAGLIAVMGYECQGKRTARVKRHKDPNNEQESVMKDRSLSKVLGIGLIAWEVDSKSVFEPTKSLFPTINGTYPATFIVVRWEGDIWTWESREDFHSLMEDLS